ncbi:hypothetical protein CgunFtcFv8_009334 [Champsocephalus gunnari]|uniref:Uncharacterized protein n=1 Tax=Champsocephalus gunnari TaxID=52237 RepID=A0AAN8GYJ0_CHAGU|nr:hypothetical protein CgunFtcFv8_009334 [Champsocephalus gunnari]
MRTLRRVFHCLSSKRLLLPLACPDHLIRRRGVAAAGRQVDSRAGRTKRSGKGKGGAEYCVLHIFHLKVEQLIITECSLLS